METHQHQKNTENDVPKQQLSWQQQDREDDQASSSPSSPSQEFSFTISLHHPTFPQDNQPSSIALDLSPADDIFFHGHLLPLHLLSHLPSSPRSSTNSIDSFTLPITHLLEDQNHPIIKDSSTSNSTTSSHSNSSRSTITDQHNDSNNMGKKKVQGKSKFTFSLFGLVKGHKGCRDSKEDTAKHKKKVRFDVIHAMKKYLRMVQPKMLFKGQREKIRPSCGQSYSYSGNVTPTNYKQSWREQYSAPASMRTSPTNSGLLIATTPLPSSARDSTMEELQAAIQAAIAHCKNSIAKEEKLKC
ncbi:BRI1 kinase inhibitor 1-like [Vigna radiata var. radiata]|uniref:BRI1 kinase inhibitor 1-like n=1 Tax=Vigna radiata var. radiata TaxID=3916 RepID=A0A1S3UCV0_VIGRR|nr:BRI1 kinase inhibitor 1-like [Vigna radiata var. radiata]